MITFIKPNYVVVSVCLSFKDAHHIKLQQVGVIKFCFVVFINSLQPPAKELIVLKLKQK